MDARRLPSLTAMHAFETAARHLSFKRAAVELSLTPTAISHQVRQLEDRLGVRLFVRGTRRVDLTEAGQMLYPVLRDGFDAMAQVVRRLRPEAGPRMLAISAPVLFASRWLLPRVAGFASAHPGLVLYLHASDEVVDLATGAAKLAIRYGAGRYSGLRSVPLLASRFAPVCAPVLNVRSFDDLARVPLIGFEWKRRDAHTPDWPLWFERAGCAPIERQVYFSDEAHGIQAAIAGQGVALANLSLLGDALRDGVLLQPFGPQLEGAGFHLVWPQGDTADADIAAVRDWLLAQVRIA